MKKNSKKTEISSLSLVLASASPRRRQILTNLGWEIEVILPEGEEPVAEGGRLEAVALGSACVKARSVHRVYPHRWVVGADTVVGWDGEVLGKPNDETRACAMLGRLSGRTHQVVTGVALCGPDFESSFCVQTEVKFLPLDPQLIEAYAATGEPLDKAGAYGIQGLGSLLVEEIKGDYNNVVGFPLAAFLRHLRDHTPLNPFELKKK